MHDPIIRETAVLLAVCVLASHVCLVLPRWNRRFWFVIDYLWLLLTAFGLITAVAESRALTQRHVLAITTNELPAHIATAAESLDTPRSSIPNYISRLRDAGYTNLAIEHHMTLTSNFYTRSFSAFTDSPTLDTSEAIVADGAFFFSQFPDISNLPTNMAIEAAIAFYRRDFRHALSELRGLSDEFRLISNGISEAEADSLVVTLKWLAPLLIALGLSIRIAKVTATILGHTS